VKVEQALRLLPQLDALMPLRTLLLTSARSDDRTLWAGSGEYRTVGKREVEPAEMRLQMGQVLGQITAHLAGLYEAFIEALESIEGGDSAAAVTPLLSAGKREESIGRLDHARAWYTVALTLSEGLQNRRPEVETLLSLGRVAMDLGHYEESARNYQRGLVLAEAEFDEAGAMLACEGLGHVAVEQARWAGAQAWYARAMRLAETVGDERRIGQIHLALGEFARRKGELTSAGEELRRARERFEALGDAREMARVLTLQGLVDADLGEMPQASAAYREALAWTRRAEPDVALEVFIRTNFAKLHLAAGRYLEAEQEIRRAEQLAIAGNLPHQLVQIYALMGTSRGRQGDEAGFVFFEQAIELARTLDRSPLVEARVCYEYGVFQNRIARPDESRAYLEHAREIFESIGASVDLERVEAELHRLSA
jgi:tetratricopeptide (TPR) repeat protein